MTTARPPPKTLDIVAAMNSPKLFQSSFLGPSWDHWRIVLKAAFALPMSAAEIEFFRSVAARDPPATRVKELWIIVGRRGGKDSIASLIISYIAALFNKRQRLRSGEIALCVALACDREQSKIVLGYTKSYFADIPTLKRMVKRETSTGLELSNHVEIAVGTNSFRSVRGRPILCAVLDETAFYRDETSAKPDVETYRALTPGMATLAPDAMLIGISTPYRKAGLLYKKYRDHYGKAGDDVLVIKAPTTALNPTIDADVIEAALIEDPAAASAEWLAEFRDDIAGWASYELIEAAVDRDIKVRPPLPDVTYHSFIDGSGGVRDSYCAAVAHAENGVAILDCLIEVRAPFNPDSATADVAKVLKSYRCFTTTGDHYSAEWIVSAFAKCGITYRHSDRDRSAIYLDALPLFTTGRARLLDNKRLVTQLASLERKTMPSGKDRVDHGPGGHDDAANVAAGAMVLATATRLNEVPLVPPIIVSQTQPPSPGTSTTQAFYDYYNSAGPWWGPI
jgi:hypothetical protein